MDRPADIDSFRISPSNERLVSRVPSEVPKSSNLGRNSPLSMLENRCHAPAMPIVLVRGDIRSLADGCCDPRATPPQVAISSTSQSQVFHRKRLNRKPCG